MQKKFIGNLLLLLLVNLVVKPLWIFGIDLKVQNEVGTEEYGFYAAALSFVMIFNILLDLGLANYSNRSIAREPEKISRHFSELILLKLLLATIFLLLALGLGFFLDYWERGFRTLLWLSLAQVLSSLVYFLRSHLAGLHLFKWDAVMSVLDKTLMILLCGYFLYFPASTNINVELFALMQVISFFLTAALGMALVLGRTQYFLPRWHWAGFVGRLKQSLPFALLVLLMSLYTRVDSVMLQQLIGDQEAGIYAQAYRLLDVLIQPGYLFSVLLLPIFSGMLARKESVSELSRLALVLMVVMNLAMALSLAFNASALMDFLYHEHSAESGAILSLLVFSVLAFGSNFVFGTLLTAKGELKVLNFIAGGGFLLNLVLNLFLIPNYGAWGASLATLITQSATALLQMFYALREMKLGWESAFWLRLSLFFLGSGLIAWGVKGLSLGLGWGMLATALTIALWALPLGLLPILQAWQTLKLSIKQKST